MPLPVRPGFFFFPFLSVSRGPWLRWELKAEAGGGGWEKGGRGGFISILYFDTDWVDLGMALVLATTGMYHLWYRLP